MGRAAADDDHVEALDFEHGREGVAAVRVGLVLVVGGEAGAHFFYVLMACAGDAAGRLVVGLGASRVDGVGDAASAVVGFCCQTVVFCKRCLWMALEDDEVQSF